MLKVIFFWENSTSESLLSNHRWIVMICSTLFMAALMCERWLLPAHLSNSEEDLRLKKRPSNKPCNTSKACWKSWRHFLLLLPSSGHTFFVKLRFSLQEIVTKVEDQKKYERSHGLSSWSPFPVCACQPKYCLLLKQRRNTRKLIQGLRA